MKMPILRRIPVRMKLALRKNLAWFTGTNATTGSALVEFAVIAPILLIFAIYTMDLGLLAFNKMEVQQAAQAGAQYVIGQGTYDASKISSAVTNATRFTAVTGTSSNFCGCPTTSGVTVCATSCGSCSASTCATTAQGNYVKVTATPTSRYTPFISFGAVSGTYDLSASSTVRIR
jgi:Flp pilus assembly protein TadG